MTETLSTSKEVPKIKLGLQEKYNQEKKEEPQFEAAAYLGKAILPENRVAQREKRKQ